MTNTLSYGGFLTPSITVLVAIFSYHTAQGYDPYVCENPEVAGDCSMAVKKWSYDCKTNKCDSFEYSGCGGNQNRFDSKEACERDCKKDKAGCFDGKLPLDIGRGLDDDDDGSGKSKKKKKNKGSGSSSSSSSSSEEEKKPEDMQNLR